MKHLLLFVMAVSVAAGCSHGEDSACGKSVALLSGANPSEAFDAIAEGKCQEALDKFYVMMTEQEGRQYRERIMRILSKLWFSGEGVVSEALKPEFEKFEKKREVYIKILDEALKDPQLAIIALEYIQQWGIKELKNRVVEVVVADVEAGQPQIQRGYGSALAFLEKISAGAPDPALQDLMIKLLTNSPETQGAEVNAKAATILGSYPDVKLEGIQALIRGLFVRSASVQQACSQALLRIGPKALPELVNAITLPKGDPKVRYLETFATANSIPDWFWQSGVLIPLVLSQIRHPDAVLVLTKDLGRPLTTPASINVGSPQEQDWKDGQVNRIKFGAWSLRHAVDDAVLQESLRIMRDREAEGIARFEIAMSLAYQYTQAATNVLYKVVYDPEAVKAEDEMDPNAKRPEGALQGPVREAVSVVQFMRAIALASRYEDLERFNDIFDKSLESNFGDDPKFKDIELMRSDVGVQVYTKVVDVCRNNTDCYLGVLRGGTGAGEGGSYDPEDPKFSVGPDGKPVVLSQSDKDYIKSLGQTKAALVLSRWKYKDGAERMNMLKEFIKLFTDTPYSDAFEDFRYALYVGIERLAMSDTGMAWAALQDYMRQELIEKTRASKATAAKGWLLRIEGLDYFLSQYAGDPSKYASTAPKPEDNSKPKPQGDQPANAAPAAPAAEGDKKPEEKKPEEKQAETK